MKVPVSWLKDYVDITMPVEELADRITLAGLEVSTLHYIGVKGADLEWDREKLVLGHILSVEQHPNADKLVLATVDIGQPEPEVVVTGAPNLYSFVGAGDISTLNLKSPFVMEGATVYDGYSDTPGKRMKLKGRKIRGIMNRHMLCSEKELGLSDEHAGIIIDRDETAPPGTPLVDIWGDVIIDIDITPNLVRCASILGVAREVAAMTAQKLRYPAIYQRSGKKHEPLPLKIETTEPELNPRFVAILIENITVKESPYWMQRRLRLAGMRPISNIVDISNYVMLEVGQPNHAFDWDVLQRRAQDYANNGPVQLITRLAKKDEAVLTLDDKTHTMPDFSILVTDPKSNLSIGGIMGGGETEVSDASQNILLEAAAWNYINIRRTSQALNIHSEAGYRFSRGIHPAQAMFGALRGAQLMLELAEGTITHNVLDYYPNPPKPIAIELPVSEVTRLLGVELAPNEIQEILESLEFTVEQMGSGADNPITLRVTTPDHRMDIFAESVTGRADLIEEIARIYGYDRIPVSEIEDELPPQRDNVALLQEEQLRDMLVQCGLQEIITYRLTTIAGEARLLGENYAEKMPYVTLANPSTSERAVLRHNLLNSVLEIAADNSKHHQRIQLFEVGQTYLPVPATGETNTELPDEKRRLAIVMTGVRETISWLPVDESLVDFFDLKGITESILQGLHIKDTVYLPTESPIYYPGRVAELVVNGQHIGLLGQLHPLIVEAYDFKIVDDQPILAADFDLDLLLNQIFEGHTTQAVSRFPAVQQDIALVVDEHIPADKIAMLIAQTGKPLLVDVTLFDVFKGKQLGAGKKSLAYSLTFQSPKQTLNDKAVAKQQTKIIKRLERELGARLRS